MSKPKNLGEFLRDQRAKCEERAVAAVRAGQQGLFEQGKIHGDYAGVTRLLDELEALMKSPNDTDID